MELNRMKPLLLPLIAILTLFAASSLPPAARASTRTSAVQHAPTPTDAELQARIEAKLSKSKIGRDGFRFHVQRGVVTWEGTTNVVQHKGSATRMARAAGAARVVNNIRVSTAGKAKAASSLKKASVQ